MVRHKSAEALGPIEDELEEDKDKSNESSDGEKIG